MNVVVLSLFVINTNKSSYKIYLLRGVLKVLLILNLTCAKNKFRRPVNDDKRIDAGVNSSIRREAEEDDSNPSHKSN